MAIKSIILFFLISINVQDPFQDVDKFVSENQFSDALELLNKIDPNNQHPEAYRRKIEICIDNYIISIGHHLFGLKNLENGETVDNLRGQDGNYSMYMLDIENAGKALLDKFPYDYKLKFAIGKYYHSMHLNCGDCTISTEESISNFKSLFTESFENGVYDYNSLYAIGYAHVYSQAFKESIPYFLKSIELNIQYPSSHYNLAYAYLYMDDRQNCIKYAKNALELYSNSRYKSDAAKMIATAYQELKDDKNAYKYFKTANKIMPNEYYILYSYLNISVKLDKKESAELRQSFFQLDPDNPTIYQNLIDIYVNNKKMDELLDFFNNLTYTYNDEPSILGNLYFYSGMLGLELNKVETAKDHFKRAKIEFENIYEPNHQVFTIINEFLDEMKN